MADDLNLLHGTVTDGGGDETFADPGNANDGVLASSAVIGPGVWGGTPQVGYLETDLGTGYEIDEHVVWGDWECASDPTLDVDNGWHLQSSDDGSSWDDVAYTSVQVGDIGTDQYRVRFILDTAETHRYWRIRYSTMGGTFHCGTSIATWEIFGLESPTEPPVDPGYEPPGPGHAILEIYVHDEDATRWGTATWGDNPPTGTTGIWSGAGWQDVTPQGVTAHITWGTSRPERGILAVQEAQDWLVTTYDPERILDPGNPDGPYWPQLVSGVPIRISDAHSGTVIRTGIIDSLRYRYKAPDYRGEIRASSTIAALWRADVPEDSTLGDTLRTRIRDAVIASGITIGGIPILGNDDSYPDIDLSPRIEGKVKLWEHIRRAAEEVLWIVYEDHRGMLQSRPWGGGIDRGREITYENLEDLEVTSSEDGIYSVVYVTNEDGSAVIERVAAPLPRYGRIPYERDETTINPELWADAVLADRAWPGLTWTPGTVWAFTAADVEYFATLEIMEFVQIVVPGVLDIQGKVLGMELWVESTRDDYTRWLFRPRVATDGSAEIGGTLLIADDSTGDYLMDETETEYLEAD